MAIRSILALLKLQMAGGKHYHMLMAVETEIPNSPLSSSSKGNIRAPRGSALSCKGWQQEAAMRMLMNNLDEEVAERPQVLVVYRVIAIPVAGADGAGKRRDFAGAVGETGGRFQDA